MRVLTSCVAICVIATMVPGGAFAGNKETAEAVAQALRSSSQGGEFENIRIKVQNGTAWLNGVVPSKESQMKALQAANGVSGVHRVINELNVPAVAEPQMAQQPPQVQPNVAPIAYMAPQHEPRPLPAGQPQNVVRSEVQPQQMPYQQAQPVYYQQPMPMQQAAYPMQGMPMMGPAGGPIPMAHMGHGGYAQPISYDQPNMPSHAWPTYAAYPNYAAVTYPRVHSASAWPYIGPFYPYPQVPLGWRKVTLEWDDGWWMLDFDDR